MKFLLDQHLSTVPQHQWISKLFGFDFTIEYRLGCLNIMEDALSCHDAEQGAEADNGVGTAMCARSGPSFTFIDDIRHAMTAVVDA